MLRFEISCQALDYDYIIIILHYIKPEKRRAFNKPSITKHGSENRHRNAMKRNWYSPPCRCTQQRMYITVHANYPVNAHPTPDRQPREWESDGLRVREIMLQPNCSLRGRVQDSPPTSLRTGRDGGGATSNQRQHRDGGICRPARLQQSRELKAGGREVCTSELRVEYALEMVYHKSQQEIRIVTFAGPTITRAQS